MLFEIWKCNSPKIKWENLLKNCRKRRFDPIGRPPYRDYLSNFIAKFSFLLFYVFCFSGLIHSHPQTLTSASPSRSVYIVKCIGISCQHICLGLHSEARSPAKYVSNPLTHTEPLRTQTHKDDASIHPSIIRIRHSHNSYVQRITNRHLHCARRFV